MVFSWLLLLLTGCLASGTLLFNESFYDLTNWVDDIDGFTGNVSLLGDHQVFTNISHCPDTCYRAEIAVTPSMRPTVFPNCSVEYWLGMSSFIPSSWRYASAPSVQDVTYNFQLHGGDNLGNSPVLGIRLEEGGVTANICGNQAFNSTSAICSYYSLGGLSIGSWVDWVVHSKLSFNGDGYVNIWRNGVQMLSVANLLTAYNDSLPPYIKVGSYQTNWKDNITTGYSWTSIQYKAVRVGDAGSSYAEVYTGTGTPCGAACDTDSDYYTWSRRTLLLWIVVPMGIIAVFSVVLCIGAGQQPDTSSKPAQPTVGTQLENPVDMSKSNLFSFTLRYSYGNYTDQVGGNWMGRELGVFRTQSTSRKMFWYAFAVLMTAAMMVFALALYGRPVKHSKGLLPWAHLDHWTPLQASLVVITATMMTIYFLPLAYLKHDFAAGTAFKNNPKFLKRIGVIIPCHKSMNEIGEVIRRALLYIPPENIIVADNGNYEWPPDSSFSVVKAVHPKVRYVYIKQGHKTRALWTAVHRLPGHVDYVIHLDDDTHFSEHMVFDESLFEDPKCIAVAFLRSSYPLNTVTQFTDFWYKITDHFHATQARICTRCFVPGPAGMWKRDKFMEIFAAHPSLPFGEDIFGGFTTLNKGYRIGVETRCMVKTFAPPILVPWFIRGDGRVQGYGASSLWKQRAHRWTVSALRITGKSLYSFCTHDTGHWSTNIAFRLYRFREYKIILVQLLYIPLCLVIMARGFYVEFVIFKLLLFLLPLIRNILINYVAWKGQPELQVDLRTVLLSPFFNFFLIVCAIHGRWKCLLWYLPNVAPNHGMLQRCRPVPLREVKCEFNPLANQSTQSLQSMGDSTQDTEPDTEEQDVVSALHDDVENNLGALAVQPTAADHSLSGSIPSGKSSSRRSAARKISMPERILQEYPDSFELFERDGASKIVNFITA